MSILFGAKNLLIGTVFILHKEDVKKTIFVDYDTSSVLISEGYEISWGTVYGHQEEPDL